MENNTSKTKLKLNKMHVIKARQDPSKVARKSLLKQSKFLVGTEAPSRQFATGSGIEKLSGGYSAASKPASQRSVPPSTRAFAKNYAAFHGEASVSSEACS